MKTILILGGYGHTGKSLARHLLKETAVNIVLAGRNIDKAQSFAAELDDPRVAVRQVDATHFDSLQQALRGVALCLVAAPTSHYSEIVVKACVELHVDYLDVQFSSRKLGALYAARQQIKDAGLCFITEAGYHPGMPAAMIRLAATKLDILESALTAGYMNIGEIPFTEAVDELMEAFLDYQAQVYKNRAWTKPTSWQTRKFDFGKDIGAQNCYSMFFEELRGLPQMIPTLEETGFYISGSNWLADLVITPLVFAGLKLAPRRGIRPLGKLMWWAMGKSRPPYRVALVVKAKGMLDGRQADYSARITHPDGYELTAIPVVAYLLQYLDGSARRPGLHMMGHIAEPVRLFKDLQRMGVEVTEG